MVPSNAVPYLADGAERCDETSDEFRSWSLGIALCLFLGWTLVAPGSMETFVWLTSGTAFGLPLAVPRVLGIAYLLVLALMIQRDLERDDSETDDFTAVLAGSLLLVFLVVAGGACALIERWTGIWPSLLLTIPITVLVSRMDKSYDRNTDVAIWLVPAAVGPWLGPVAAGLHLLVAATTATAVSLGRWYRQWLLDE